MDSQSKKPVISIIVACGSQNRVIGNNGEIPWYIPEDFAHFKKVTSGHPVIIGDRTFESIGKVLPNRKNIIVTRDVNYTAPVGVAIAHSMEDALGVAKENDNEEVFIIGGGQIYALGIPFADRLYVTEVETDAEGDAYFPEYKSVFTKVISEDQNDNGDYKFNFRVLEK